MHSRPEPDFEDDPTPALKRHHKIDPGRFYDAARSASPPIVREVTTEDGARWKAFMVEGPGGPQRRRASTPHSGLDDLVRFPSYSQPFRPYRPPNEDPESQLSSARKKRSVWWKRAQRTLLRNPFIPLVLRTMVGTFCLAALVLAAVLYHRIGPNDVVNPTSPIMAIVVDTIAILYLIRATWDEYTSKPLGLRSPKAKVSIVLLDLNFIIFGSANLTLAFEAVSQRQCGSNAALCARQNALASVLLAGLIAWVLTFVVSILRLVGLLHAYGVILIILGS